MLWLQEELSIKRRHSAARDAVAGYVPPLFEQIATQYVIYFNFKSGMFLFYFIFINKRVGQSTENAPFWFGVKSKMDMVHDQQNH